MRVHSRTTTSNSNDERYLYTTPSSSTKLRPAVSAEPSVEFIYLGLALLFGQPSGAQSRQLLRLTAAIPLFDVGAMYLGLMNEAALAALLDNRSRAEWRAAAAALASAALAATAAAGGGDGSSSSSARDAEADASCMPPNTFSTRQPRPRRWLRPHRRLRFFEARPALVSNLPCLPACLPTCIPAVMCLLVGT